MRFVHLAITLLTISLTLVAQTPAEAGGSNAPGAVSAASNSATQDAARVAASDKVPYLTFGLDHIQVLRYELFDIPLWQYAASVIYVIVSMWIARLVDWFVRVYVKRLTEKTETTLDDMLLELLHGPVRVVSFVFLLHVGLHVFHWPEWIEDYMSLGLKLAVAGSVTWMLMKAVDIGLNTVKERAVREQDKAMAAQLLPMLGRIIKIIILVISIIVTGQNLGFQISGLLASVSVGGLAIGLAAQDSLANIFGAVTIFTDKPFRIGDRIQVDKVDGVVEAIGMRSTRVRALDGALVSIPNRVVGNSTVINMTARPAIRTDMNIALVTTTTTEQVRVAARLIEEVCRAHPTTKEVTAGFSHFAESALNVRVLHWSKEIAADAHVRAMQDINLDIKTRLEAAGIEMAFPTRTLIVKSEKAS
jgi:MscS family membrane protein